MRLLRIAFTTLFIFLLSPWALAQGPGGGMGHDDQGGAGHFPGHDGLELEHNLVLPQIAVGRDISTTLVIANQAHADRLNWLDPDDLQVQGEVRFFAQDGSPLEVSINGAAPASQFSFQLGTAEMLFLR